MTGHKNSCQCWTREKSVTQKWTIPHAHFYPSVVWRPTSCSLNGRPWVFKISPVPFVIWLIAERPWRRLNSNPVCFGAKDNQFGAFVVEVGGHIDAVKLIHLHGQVSCNVSKGRWSNWGCSGAKSLLVFLTNSTDDILIPKLEGGAFKYKIEGYNSNSSEIIWKDFSSPIRLTSGQELRLWHSTDLMDHGESNNDGTSCSDVFALYL